METLHVAIYYKNQATNGLLLWRNFLLHTLQTYKAISPCSKSVEQASTKSILVSCIITSLQKLQQAKPTWAVPCKIWWLALLPTRLKSSGALQMHHHAVKTIVRHDYNGECCALNNSGSEYLENSNIWQKYFFHKRIEVFPKQSNCANVFVKNIRVSVLPREDLHTVILTVVYDILLTCCEKTATTLLIAK